MEPWSGETKYRAILAISEAANEHLDLSALLDAVAVALEEIVPVDVVGVRKHFAPDVPSGHAVFADKTNYLALPPLYRPKIAIEELFKIVDRIAVTSVDEGR